jgi:NADH-quinone oxidoreductase subunit M
MGLLTLTVALPLAGAVLLGDAPDRTGATKIIAMVTSLATFAASVAPARRLRPGRSGCSWSSRPRGSRPSAREIALRGRRGQPRADPADDVPHAADPAGVVGHHRRPGRGYLIAFLVLEAMVIGVFAATDLLLFYVFFEFSLVPMYLIIGIWGGAGGATPR